MRRTLAVLLILFVGGLALSTLQPVRSQNESHLIPITPPANWERIITAVPEPTPIPVELTPLDNPPDITAPSSVGADSCGGAVALAYSYDLQNVMSDQTAVSSFLVNDDDPSLAGCFARPTTNSTGYRSVWYRFDNFTTIPETIVPQDGSGVNGRLVVRTEPNEDYRQNYDTLIAVYAADDCTNLTRLTCNDDTYALLSEVSIPVADGQRYYIEVVDINAPASGPLTVNLVAEVIPSGEWDARSPLPQPTSRNAVVMDGSQAYILGGQTFLQGQGRRTGRTYRYDTNTGDLTELALHTAATTIAGEGYSNHNAVLVGDKIHMPSGDIGAPDTYDGTHWVYDIPSNTWEIYSAENGYVDPPWGPRPGTDVPGFTEVTPFALGDQVGLYVLGGLTGTFFAADAGARGSTFRYVEGSGNDPSFWQILSSMNTPRYAHTGVVLGNGRVCVVGGLSDGPSLITNGECYFPTSSPPGWQVSVGDLNVPRYLADSAIGPDGRWYVFGGYDATSNPVEEVEVFDPNTGTWEILGINYHITAPRLGWVQGGFVGPRLWLFGGEQAVNIPVSQVQVNRLPIDPVATSQQFLPLISFSDPGQSLESAWPLTLNETAVNSFTEAGEVYHIYRFDLTQTTNFVITLDNIPFGSNYDLLMYNDNKEVVALGQNLGSHPERIGTTFPAGRYYLFVVRDAPPPAVPPDPTHYRLLVATP